jgi:PadR family transcriptional regulator, regulatory protein PadR
MSERGEPRGRDPSGTIGRNLEPFLLLELLRAPSYGYDMIRRLGAYGFRRAISEPAVVYKVLRSLEEAGSIASEWSTEGSGPARRYYELTDAGRDLLRRRVRHLSRYRDRVDQLLQDYTALTDEDPSELAAEEVAMAEPVGARSRRAAE